MSANSNKEMLIDGQMKQDPSLVRSRNHQAERVKLDTTQFQNHTLTRLLESSSERMKTH